MHAGGPATAMSIINDALKKTQDNLLTKAPQPPSEEPKSPVLAETPPPPPSLIAKAEFKRTQAILKPKTHPFPISKDKLFVASAVILCIGLLGGMSFLLSGVSTNGTTKHKKNNAIVINGVMKKNDKTVALINDEVYEIGETINGMKIVDISLDRIDFLYRNRIRSFKVHRKLE